MRLGNRLRVIQEIKRNDLQKEKPIEKDEKKSKIPDTPQINLEGWEQCGYMVLKREIITDVLLKINTRLPQAIKVIIPDLVKIELPKTEDFLFFDLETTGLSGGAGTIAFLAAFGRIINEKKLLITQYLLLDYPGQYYFLEAVLHEFNKSENSIIVTYNGKSFDAQILKNMCLMNGIKPPVYQHADLVHPARRLWKNIIGDCSQTSIETNILGLSREGDIPGAMAPDIWFDFLKNGKTEMLIGICDHNTSDIKGLCGILAAMIEIAENPMNKDKFNFDIPRLAFYWRYFCCYGKRYLMPEYREILDQGIKLLRFLTESDFNDEVKCQAERFLNIYERRWKKYIL